MPIERGFTLGVGEGEDFADGGFWDGEVLGDFVDGGAALVIFHDGVGLEAGAFEDGNAAELARVGLDEAAGAPVDDRVVGIGKHEASIGRFWVR